MEKWGDGYALSASDLVGILNCEYLTDLDRAVADGVRPKPASWNPALEALRQPVQSMRAVCRAPSRAGHDVAVFDSEGVSATAIAQTIAAMQADRSIIIQMR
jgi:uncharacterized protein